jgi:cytochrome c5
MAEEVHVEEHESLIKTPQQLIVVVVLAFLIPVLGIILIAELATGGLKVDSKSSAMSDAAVAERLKPVGTAYVGEVPAEAMAAAGAKASPGGAGQAASSPAKAGGAVDGKAIYGSVCTACHGAGIAGAPKTGDKAAWKPRIAQGNATLYEHAIKGKGAMPPKGGAMSASDAEIKAAVDYLVSQGK